MMNSVLGDLAQLNYPKDKILTESFSGAFPSTGEGSLVTVSYKGKEYNGLDNQTILEILQENDIDYPFECLAGGCESCKARITHGLFEAPPTQIFSEKQRKEGYVLTCQTYPKTDIILSLE